MTDQPKPDRAKILMICGSMNQTTSLHQISNNLKNDYDIFFTPFYIDGFWEIAYKWKSLSRTIAAGQFKRRTKKYLRDNNLAIDFRGKKFESEYKLIVTCQDVYIPKNIKKKSVILIQEGMTDPKNFLYYLAKYLKLPRWIASTAAAGLSNCYAKFCVASEGYKNFFIRNGVKARKIVVTGIPNYDDCARFLKNDFPHKGYVLVASSDMRETFKKDNRLEFIRRCVKIAAGKKIIFKLHPNEEVVRATAEIKSLVPDALIYTSGNTDFMVANCEILITQYSTVAFTGIALGKETYSYFDVEDLKKLCPIQNEGQSAANIAAVCRDVLEAGRA